MSKWTADQPLARPPDATMSFSEILKEARLLLNIALPTVAVQFSAYFIFPQTASAVGRNLGTEELAGFSLASLTGNMTCLSVIVGALTATDTLMPRAFGTGRYSEVGKLAIRGFAVCAMILVFPVVPLCTAMDTIFDALGQDRRASMLASLWIRVYILGVPFVLLFRCIQKFLAAQHVVMPMVYAGLVGCFVVHPILLRIMVPSFGFVGSGVAIVATQCLQAIFVLLYLYFRPVHHPETWPGFSVSIVKEAIRPEPMLQFLKLSMGGVLSFSEWWFWETVCFLAGHMGVIPLCIHTIAYNLVPMTFMIPLGFSIGLSVRMGHVLATDVPRAKTMAATCMIFTVAIAVVLATLLYHLRKVIVKLFTNDEDVIQGCEEIWGYLCIYIVLLYIFGINSGIMRALGMQWRMATIICLVLWLLALPTLIQVAIRQGGGVTAIWSHLPVFYFFMNVLLIHSYVTADWTAISDNIRERKENSTLPVATERTLLVGFTGQTQMDHSNLG